MGKNSHFTGQPVLNQLLNFIDRREIDRISKKGKYDRYIKKLDGYTHLVAMLYGTLMRFDSLREIVLGMMSEANKLSHLGVDYVIRRSTLSDANNRRSSDFFASIYSSLYKRYKPVLSDSCKAKEWEDMLHIMDSTTISLFSNILKGAGRNPKHGKKKGGIKAHTIIKATENVPYFIHFTSAATHDHCLLKYVDLPSGSIIALDRAYIDYKQFENFTEAGITYVTKMKKNLTYKVVEDVYDESKSGYCTFVDQKVMFEKGDVVHLSRMIKYWDVEKQREIVLLTNSFEFSGEDIIEIYKRRWQIELLYKQLKQNFPLKYFYGDSVNAIKIQIWVSLIANLLLTLVQKKVKRRWSFSNMATMIRQMLMYYIDLYKYLENPEKAWIDKIKESPPEIDPELALDWA